MFEANRAQCNLSQLITDSKHHLIFMVKQPCSRHSSIRASAARESGFENVSTVTDFQGNSTASVTFVVIRVFVFVVAGHLLPGPSRPVSGIKHNENNMLIF